MLAGLVSWRMCGIWIATFRKFYCRRLEFLQLFDVNEFVVFSGRTWFVMTG